MTIYRFDSGKIVETWWAEDALGMAHKTSGEASPATESDRTVLLLNSDALPGREITEILGLVQGHTVFAVWLGKDLSAIVRLILGGELTEYAEMMGSARSTATERMTDMAAGMGADAVINEGSKDRSKGNDCMFLVCSEGCGKKLKSVLEKEISIGKMFITVRYG